MHTLTFERIDPVLDGDESTFRASRPAIVETLSDDATLATLLLDQPTLYARFGSRLGTMDAPDAVTETLERAVTIVFDGMSLIAAASPAVQKAITASIAVNFIVTNSDIEWHLQTDRNAGSISGGPTSLSGASVTVSGPATVICSLICNESYNRTLAFIQNRFELTGSLQDARRFNRIMDDVRATAQNLPASS